MDISALSSKAIFWNDVGFVLLLAETDSMNHEIAEGLVFKSITDPSISFKAINNMFLLKGGN